VRKHGAGSPHIRYINLLSPFFGLMPEHLLRSSLELFAHEVMPSFAIVRAGAEPVTSQRTPAGHDSREACGPPGGRADYEGAGFLIQTQFRLARPRCTDAGQLFLY